MNRLMSTPIWNIKNLTLNGDRQPRLDDISASIPSGVTAIVGHSGAGKTSLLNVLAGLEKPHSGTTEFRYPSENAGAFYLPIFWAPQDDGLWPHLSAAEHLTAVFDPNSSFSTEGTQDSEQFLDNLLVQFDLDLRQQALPSELSWGEKSRLAVCRALAANPAVLIMDEPLAHVDPIRRPIYWKLIRDHVETTGASLLFSTHQPDVAVKESTFVICMQEGKIVHTGTTLDLYHQPTSQKAAEFLGAINWFAAEEISDWLQSTASGGDAIAIRPENLQLVVVENGDVEILSFQFCGGYSETHLKHIPTNKEKTIVHRPPDNVFAAGQRVAIKVHS